jgi:hypothetical protein
MRNARYSLAALAAALLLGGPAAAAEVVEWPLPVETASQPNLTRHGDALLLSWIESRDGLHRLRYARDAGGGFGAPREIAQGRDWFVNWADFPALAALPDGRMAAHFLQKSAAAPYAYDVRLTQSADGVRWSAPVTVHEDGTRTEHGFVALWPWSADAFAIAWLDGRHTGGGGEGGHGGHQGMMTLRGAVFGAEGKREEWALDGATCDCCQTDVAQAAAGPVLVYRDRTPDEIRDVALTRYRDGAWTAPVRVHADEWKMPACPVNGPAVAAQGRAVHVAWYTAAAGEPELRLAHSKDDGGHFEAPVTVARGPEVQGRVDLVRAGDAVYVSWLSEDATGQRLWLARYRPDLAGTPERVEVARLARGRGTGFPRLALRDGVLHLVFTDIVERQPRLRGVKIRFEATAPRG